MKKKVLIVAAILAVLAIGITCVGVYAVRTPEFALLVIAKDVKTTGIEGLRPHLTVDALKTLDTVTSLADNKLVGALVGLFVKEEQLGDLMTQLEQVQWKLEDIVKNGDTAEVVLRFNYDDRFVGTVTFTMVKGEEGWQIDSLELPKFEEVNGTSK